MIPPIDAIVLHQLDQLDLGDVMKSHLRYQALRRLTPSQFRALHDTNIATGESVDSLVDALVVDMHTDKERTRP